MAHKKHIASFRFDYAQYEVEDGQGNKALLKVHYAANTFQVEEGHLPVSPSFRRDLAAIAGGLLRRKHGVNFADHV